jgi:acetylornithine deacetylase/succinyl-diaminopimelate desuccinylase-like protein
MTSSPRSLSRSGVRRRSSRWSRANNLYGRGACDDKGQLFTHVKALESYLKTERKLPVNVKCIFEGEEELGGSPGLENFVNRNQSALRADAALMSDTRMLGPGRPALGYAQRGNIRFELEVSGPQHDLHSGNFGGAVHNPLQALCEIIAGLHDSDGRVTVHGFYDKVREWSAEERGYMERTGPKDQDILRDAGVSKEWGEAGYSLYERVTIRPALTVNGISGGYQGAGIKTVIPARALAKISIRLVPDQNPREVEQLVRRHIVQAAPSTVSVKMKTLGVSNPALVNRNHPALRAAAFAYQKGLWSEAGIPSLRRIGAGSKHLPEETWNSDGLDGFRTAWRSYSRAQRKIPFA